jgi:hypothetical protein
MMHDQDSRVKTFALSVIAVILLSISEGRQNGLEDHANARLHGTREAVQDYSSRKPSRWCPVLLPHAQCGPATQSFRTVSACWRHTTKLRAGNCAYVSAIQGQRSVSERFLLSPPCRSAGRSTGLISQSTAKRSFSCALLSANHSFLKA